MPRLDLPMSFLIEEEFAEWARRNGCDETDETFADYERDRAADHFPDPDPPDPLEDPFFIDEPSGTEWEW